MRLDQALVERGLAKTRNQAAELVKLGRILVNEKPATKPAQNVQRQHQLRLNQVVRYVSRAAYKLASVVDTLGVDFRGKTVLDVGASTGGFSDLAHRSGAAKIYAIDVGTKQLAPELRQLPSLVSMEKTDIRNIKSLPDKIDIAIADVSFISLRFILPGLVPLLAPAGVIVAMVKPQFETDKPASRRNSDLHKGVVKNDTIRRRILKDFEGWASSNFLLVKKADSRVPGSKGNLERFYLLKPLKPLQK